MKKGKILLLIFVLILIMFSFSVKADSSSGTSSGAASAGRNIANTLHKLFGFIPELVTVESLASADDKSLAVFIIRFMIWVLLFTLLHFGAKKALAGAGKGTQTTIAFVLALMGSILIPTQVVKNIFSTYSFIGMMVLYAIPLFGGWYLIGRFENHWVKSGLWAVIAVVLAQISATMPIMLEGQPGLEYAGFFDLFMVVAVFGAIKNLFGAGGRASIDNMGDGIDRGIGRGIENTGNGIGNFGRGIWNSMFGGGNDAQQEAIREGELNNYIRQAEDIERGLDRDRRLLDSQEIINIQNEERLTNVMTQNKAQIEQLYQQLDSIEDKIKNKEAFASSEVKEKIEKLRSIIDSALKKQLEYQKAFYKLVDREEANVNAEEDIDKKSVDVATKKVDAETILSETEKNLEKKGGAAGESARTRRKTTKTGTNVDKETAKTTAKAVSKEEEVKKDLKKQKVLIGKIAALTKNFLERKDTLPERFNEQTIEQLNDLFRDLGKSQKNKFENERQVIALHEKIKKMKIKDDNIETVRKGLIQKAHNALNGR